MMTSTSPRATRYIDRFVEALALLCGGKMPDRDMVLAWEDDTSEALQDWAACNSVVPWSTGIGTIEAAQTLADCPEEGMEHELREDAFPAVNPVPAPAAALVGAITAVMPAGSWSLSVDNHGEGKLASETAPTLYFQTAWQLDDVLAGTPAAE